MKKVSSRFDNYEPITIKCPHCGKEMVLKDKKSWKRRTFEWEDRSCYDEDFWGGYSYESESCACPTFHCDNCDITAVHLDRYDDVDGDTVKGEIVSLYDEHSTGPYDYHYHSVEFLFPKNFEKTITQKQSNYIAFLCQKYGYVKPYFTNVELASTWISKHVDKSKKTDFDARVKTLVVMEFGRHGYDRKNNQCVFSPREPYKPGLPAFASLNEDEWKKRWPEEWAIKHSLSPTKDFSVKHSIKVDFSKKTSELNYSISESNFDIDEMTKRIRPELKAINDEFMEIAKAIDDIWTESEKAFEADDLDWRKHDVEGYNYL